MLYLPMRIKIAAARATIPKMTLGIASPGIKAVMATKIRYTAKRINPMLLVSFIKIILLNSPCCVIIITLLDRFVE